jgi:hypothetical protein
MGSSKRRISIGLALVLVGAWLASVAWRHTGATEAAVPPGAEERLAADGVAPESTPGPADADVRPNRIPAAGPDDVVVRCIDASSRAALSGVAVDAKRVGVEVAHTTTDTNGDLAVSDTGVWTFVVDAPGHFVCTTTLECVRGVNVIAVEPCATLEVRLVRADGSPVPGVKLSLVPPLAPPRMWGDGWQQMLRGAFADRESRRRALEAWATSRAARGEDPSAPLPGLEEEDLWADPAIADFVTEANCIRTTDDEGVAVWSRMPLASGYRWGVLSTHAVRVEPANELRRLESHLDGTITMRTDAPLKLSGRIELAPGVTKRITAGALANGSVTGTIDFHGATARDAHVRLLDAHAPDGARPDVLERQVAADLSLSDAGRFLFEGVAPGLELVRAFWWTEDWRVHTAAVEFELAEGEVKDLGRIVEREGSSLTLRARLCDAQGRDVPLADVFEDELPTLTLLVGVSANSRRATDRFWESFEVPVGRPFTVLGVQPGYLMLQASPGSRFHVRRGDGSRRVRLTRDIHESIEGDTTVELPLVVEELTAVSVHVRMPPDAEVGCVRFQAANLQAEGAEGRTIQIGRAHV